MLPKEYRLHREDNVPHIIKKGIAFQTPTILFKFVQNEKENSRFSVIVSKKVAAPGIKRNTLRRRIYEAIRTNLKEEILDKKEKKPHFDIVILPSKKTLGTSYKEIEKTVITFLKHINE